MTVRITTAPCCWGVDDVRNPHLPPWERVLDEAEAAGYDGIELGPFGYMPLDVERLGTALTSRGLRMTAGTIFDDLVSPANRGRLLEQADAICGLIRRLPRFPGSADGGFVPPFLVLIDWGHEARDYAAGHSDRAQRLDHAAWSGMMQTIRALATRAYEQHGIRAVVHPHAGGHVEFADEIARTVSDIAHEVAGLCLDTGHLAYSGMDPVESLACYRDRLDYLHFKDIDPHVFRRVMEQRIRFFDACAEGVMCPIGRGSIDYPAVRDVLRSIGYTGPATVEQERDPRNASDSLEDIKASRDFLRSAGFE